MTMKTDELSKPLLTPNGAALKRELARAINYIESVSEAIGHPADQAAELDAVMADPAEQPRAGAVQRVRAQSEHG